MVGGRRRQKISRVKRALVSIWLSVSSSFLLFASSFRVKNSSIYSEIKHSVLSLTLSAAQEENLVYKRPLIVQSRPRSSPVESRTVRLPSPPSLLSTLTHFLTRNSQYVKLASTFHVDRLSLASNRSSSLSLPVARSRGHRKEAQAHLLSPSFLSISYLEQRSEKSLEPWKRLSSTQGESRHPHHRSWDDWYVHRPLSFSSFKGGEMEAN